MSTVGRNVNWFRRYGEKYGGSLKKIEHRVTIERSNPTTGFIKVRVKAAQSCPTLRPHGLHSPWDSPGQNTGVGCLSLLQGIFPTQGSKLGLPHCRWILYQLSHKGSLRILEWVAYIDIYLGIYPKEIKLGSQSNICTL